MFLWGLFPGFHPGLISTRPSGTQTNSAGESPAMRTECLRVWGKVPEKQSQILRCCAPQDDSRGEAGECITGNAEVWKSNRRCFASLSMTVREGPRYGRMSGNAEVWKGNRRCFAALSMTVRLCLIRAVNRLFGLNAFACGEKCPKSNRRSFVAALLRMTAVVRPVSVLPPMRKFRKATADASLRSA